MFAARRLAIARPLAFRPAASASAPFHSSAPLLVKVGDKIPDVELMEGSPGNKVSISKELKGKGLIIGKLSTKKQWPYKLLQPLGKSSDCGCFQECPPHSHQRARRATSLDTLSQISSKKLVRFLSCR